MPNQPSANPNPRLIRSGICALLVTSSYLAGAETAIVDTGQDSCFDNLREIACPAKGDAYYGQDAQHVGNSFDFTDNGDGSITDNVTGLMWQKSPDLDGNGTIDARDKRSFDEALARADEFTLAGHEDWRLPTIKELYSLIDFRGIDPGPQREADTKQARPYLDTAYFDFAYGDTSTDERIIDAQFATNTLYVSTTGPRNQRTMFGVNFADGRIKGYGLRRRDSDKTFYVLHVRGNPGYGDNDFLDLEDGTVLDRATNLMWSREDSGKAMDWVDALAWVEASNAEQFLGYDDWRLPNIKELQSLVDYTRSPSTTGSAAIDPVFGTTPMSNEAGDADFGTYWSSTTHLMSSPRPAEAAAYINFGRSMGFMDGQWVDVHGAGAQRGDPKRGDPARFPEGRGPQGDAIRILNFVRPVRDAD
jgi:hypothetical protein